MKPILFNTEMVRAIQEGRKTVTRRVIKPQPEGKPVPMDDGSCWPGYFAIQSTHKVIQPSYHPGDVLWVRETWAKIDGEYVYRADDEIPEGWHLTVWKPSIHMPREAARIFLRVTDLRAVQLQAMGHEDAEQEGCWCGESGLDMPLDKFASLWDRTIKPGNLSAYGWEANPWVWAIYFERTCKE